MIYVMSDLHGEYEKYRTMLRRIGFCDDDTLFVLGDVVDRGPDPIAILQDMRTRPNVIPLWGNHELMAYDVLKHLAVEITAENYATHLTADRLQNLLDWQQEGGDVTLRQFAALSPVERRDLLSYLEEFSPCETVDTAKGTFILTHAGLRNFRPDKKLREYTVDELTHFTPDHDTAYFETEGVYVVCGHTPVKYLTGEWRIFHSHDMIAIDCGAAFSGHLACLCLDTMEEFYV